MTGTLSEQLERRRKAKTMRDSGASLAEIAQAFGVTRPAVSYWLRGSAALEKQTAERVKQHKQIVAAYQQGHTMAVIGSAIGMTGERVRQILKQYGIVGVPRASRQLEKRAEAQKQKERRVAKLWGLSWGAYRQLCDRYGTSESNASPFRKYISQRKSARHRGIEWKLTFAEWWDVWQSSGKWNKRGRGNGYCMARFGDEGPYAVGNVEIILTKENSRQARVKTLSKSF